MKNRRARLCYEKRNLPSRDPRYTDPGDRKLFIVGTLLEGKPGKSFSVVFFIIITATRLGMPSGINSSSWSQCLEFNCCESSLYQRVVTRWELGVKPGPGRRMGEWTESTDDFSVSVVSWSSQHLPDIVTKMSRGASWHVTRDMRP